MGIEPDTGSAFSRLTDFSVDPPRTVAPAAEAMPTVLLAPLLVPTLIELP